MGKVVTLGEIMLRLSTPGNTRFVQSDSFDVVYGLSLIHISEQFIRLNCSLMSDYKMMKLNADMKCMGLGLYRCV